MAACLWMLAQETDLDPARVPRRLRRPSAVIAGATVTDSTVLFISRRHAANRLAGSRSLSMSSGPMMLLSARITKSRAGGVGVIEGLGEFLQGLLARGPAQQAELAELPDRVIEIGVGAFDRLVDLANLLPARAVLGARRRWPSTPGLRPAPSPRRGRP